MSNSVYEMLNELVLPEVDMNGELARTHEVTYASTRAKGPTRFMDAFGFPCTGGLARTPRLPYVTVRYA